MIPLAIARAVVALAGSKGAAAAVKKFGEKYGDNVVDIAQDKIQRRAKDLTWKKNPKELTAAKKDRRAESTSKALRTKTTQKEQAKRDTNPFPKDTENEIRDRPIKISTFKKGGLVKKPKRKSIDGLARKGKTKAKHR
jgi:hypothetical protein